MNLLKNIFGSKDTPIKSYDDFWNWFKKNEKSFFKTLKENNHVQKDFLERLISKLKETQEGIYLLTGMFDDNTVELIFTVDGLVKNIVCVEELLKAAPKIHGWMFKALKPSSDINDINIEMDGYKFNKKILVFAITTRLISLMKLI